MAGHTDIRIDPGVFGAFRRWSGRVPAGFWANWLGVLTRAEVWAFPNEILTLYSKDRNETPELPAKDEHVLDWVPLLQAVAASSKTFAMAALGAGWGRWLSAGAFAAKAADREYRLVGVEAEPRHFAWMQTHLKENGIDLGRCRLIQAAAASRKGDCWFYVGRPAAWYGQSIVPDGAVRHLRRWLVKLGETIEYNGEKVQRVPAITVREAIGDIPRVDYVHMDIQGAEYAFLSAGKDLIQERVRMVNAGTHSSEIEQDLRRMFERLGWHCSYDVPMNTEVRVTVGTESDAKVKFGDGVQVWVNPRLT